MSRRQESPESPESIVVDRHSASQRRSESQAGVPPQRRRDRGARAGGRGANARSLQLRECPRRRTARGWVSSGLLTAGATLMALGLITLTSTATSARAEASATDQATEGGAVALAKAATATDEAASNTPAEPGPGPKALPDNLPAQAHIIVAPLHEEVSLGMAAFIERLVDDLNPDDILLLDINTFGGRVDAAVRIRDALLSARQKQALTIAYVHPRAISAGALISFATDVIVVASGATMGAATPVTVQGGQMAPVEEKTVSYMRQEMRATAEARDRNGDIAEAMVDADIELPGLSASGKLLTLDGNQALEWGVASFEAETFDDLLIGLGYTRVESHPAAAETGDPAPAETAPAANTAPAADTAPAAEADDPAQQPAAATADKPADTTAGDAQGAQDPADAAGDAAAPTRTATVAHATWSWAEELSALLTGSMLSGLLMSIGMLGIMIGLYTGGSPVPLAVGGTCLLLFFFGHHVVALVGIEEVLLFGLGAVLIGVEIFAPGYIVPGVIGGALVLTSLAMGLVEFEHVPFTVQWQAGWVTAALAVVFGSIAATLVVGFGAVRYLPETSLGRRFVLEAAITGRATDPLTHAHDVTSPDGADAPATRASAIGQRGVAASDLRPAGKVTVAGQRYDAVAEYGFIAAGSTVEVRRERGFSLVVRATEEDA